GARPARARDPEPAGGPPRTGAARKRTARPARAAAVRYRSRLARTCVTAAACLVWAAPAAAQSPRWEIGASGTRIAYDSLAPLQAPGLSGLVEWRRPELFARLDAGLTRFGGAGWSVHGGADAARRFPVPGAEALRLELGGRLASSRHSSGSSATLGR